MKYISTTADAEQLFEEFVISHQKQYKDENEKQMRFNIFKENLEKINEYNMESKTAVFATNKFTDLTLEEIKQRSGFGSPMKNGCSHAADKWTPTDTPFDWRDQNKVTKVKDQAFCGSCWAFSAVGNMEGQYAIKHNKLMEFSEQQLVDCDFLDVGCFGGWMEYAFYYVQLAGGIEPEDDYPYTAKDGQCTFNKTKVQATLSGCIYVNTTDEDLLKRALKTYGPLSIAVDTTHGFVYYKGGILDSCNGTEISHAVLLVGYGKENNTDYWIIKNSWGESWGEKGYIRIQMYKSCCLMTKYVVSAVIN